MICTGLSIERICIIYIYIYYINTKLEKDGTQLDVAAQHFWGKASLNADKRKEPHFFGCDANVVFLYSIQRSCVFEEPDRIIPTFNTVISIDLCGGIGPLNVFLLLFDLFLFFCILHL